MVLRFQLECAPGTESKVMGQNTSWWSMTPPETTLGHTRLWPPVAPLKRTYKLTVRSILMLSIYFFFWFHWGAVLTFHSFSEATQGAPGLAGHNCAFGSAHQAALWNFPWQRPRAVVQEWAADPTQWSHQYHPQKQVHNFSFRSV